MSHCSSYITYITVEVFLECMPFFYILIIVNHSLRIACVLGLLEWLSKNLESTPTDLFKTMF